MDILILLFASPAALSPNLQILLKFWLSQDALLLMKMTRHDVAEKEWKLLSRIKDSV